MRITERRLRSIIRSVIKEDADMRSRLSPEVKPKDSVERAFYNIQPSQEEIDDLNDIISRTIPKSISRDRRITEFEAKHGAGSINRVCDAMGIDDINHYNDEQLSI
jgi:hypothetical protein